MYPYMHLDEFISSVARAKEAEEHAAAIENMKKKITGILDPITSGLTSFDDEDDLVARIDDIYMRLDTDGSGGLTFEVRERGVGGWWGWERRERGAEMGGRERDEETPSLTLSLSHTHAGERRRDSITDSVSLSLSRRSSAPTCGCYQVGPRFG